MKKKEEFIPGVPFETQENTNFYVDVLWACVLESRENLNNIIQLDKPERDDELERLLHEPIMQKTYAIWWHFAQQKEDNPQAYNTSSKLTKLYYGPLSHTLVPLQLDSPLINKITTRMVTTVANIISRKYNVSQFKNTEEFLHAKLKLAELKKEEFGVNNSDLNQFLEELKLKNEETK